MDVNIEESWKPALDEEFNKTYFKQLAYFLKTEKKSGKTIYPNGSNIFKSFELTPFNKVKVVIIGQDPYHNPGEAMGLCFSVPKDKRVPPSLRNIYKELNQDLCCDIPQHGDLTSWAKEGVLLLNAILTVEQKSPGSHRKKGWERFTDAVIELLSKEKENLVFLLWGNFAKSKASLIDSDKHLILSSAHPSPLAGKAFFNNHHFSKTNLFLEEKDKLAIDWQIKP